MTLTAEAIQSVALSDLPCPVTTELLHKIPSEITFAGNLELLARGTTALFCSSQCPGAAILRAFDRMTHMRDVGDIILGGFHSPMERDCLRILLRGRQPVVLVLARSLIGHHVRPELGAPLHAGRLLVLSTSRAPRVTSASAASRNRFAAALATRSLIAYAAPGSRTATLAIAIERAGKVVEYIS